MDYHHGNMLQRHKLIVRKSTQHNAWHGKTGVINRSIRVDYPYIINEARGRGVEGERREGSGER